MTPGPTIVARLAGLALAGLAIVVAPASAAPRVLPAEADAALASGGLARESLAIWVQEVGAAEPRLAWQADRPVNPASLMKLVTTFAALDLLGPAWSWTTPVWLRGPVAGGVLDGDLVIKGSGDPKLVLERIWLLLRRVKQMGVREIRGDIVLDRSAFAPGDGDPADFDGEPFRPYNVGADALMLNFKSVLLTITPDAARGIATVSADPPLDGVRIEASVPLLAGPCQDRSRDWRDALKGDFSDPARLRLDGAFPGACGEKVWAVAYADPKRYNERALAGMWKELGGRLGGVVRDGAAPTGPPTFEVRSPPLADIVRDINKLSNNVMAQQLFLTLGATQRGAGTPAAARDVLQQFLKDRTGSAAGATITNGSGLSRDTRLTARMLGRLLQAAWASPVMAELISSLPITGVDGTLRRARASVGRAHLKTGSLRDVGGVAGYVLGDSGRRYVLVAIVNDPKADVARPALRAALGALIDWTADDASPAAAPAWRRH